jgi:UDP-N-acetylglucosamine/UDP-N-acetylgalactosamine 4-epimerase
MKSKELKDLKILVTGGAGFIGSHIVEYLLVNKTKSVRILDNLSTGKMQNIAALLDSYKNLEFIHGDITDVEVCKKATVDIDIVCHQAAVGSVPRSVADPLTSHNTNVTGFLNMLIASVHNNVKRFVYASSSSVYGDDKSILKVESMVGRQMSPYAVTKYADELYAQVFYRLYGLECIGLRYFNVFGPRQDPEGPYAAVIPKFIKQLINNEKPTINGFGHFSRDFTYVYNAVYANMLAFVACDSKCYGEVFNVACGADTTILELFDTVSKTLGKDLEPIFGPERVGDVPHSLADITKAREMLKYETQVDFREGIKRTVEYMKN